MSGIFLTVTENDRKPPESLLQATRGGYPHVTLVYTGTQMALPRLFAKAGAAFFEWILLVGTTAELPQLVLSAEHAYVNTFFEARSNGERHDVLLGLAPEDVAIVERLRAKHIDQNTSYSMTPPHVTHSVHYTKQAAEAVLATLRAQMPIVVTVTGYTLD